MHDVEGNQETDTGVGVLVNGKEDNCSENVDGSVADHDVDGVLEASAEPAEALA